MSKGPNKGPHSEVCQEKAGDALFLEHRTFEPGRIIMHQILEDLAMLREEAWDLIIKY